MEYLHTDLRNVKDLVTQNLAYENMLISTSSVLGIK